MPGDLVRLKQGEQLHVRDHVSVIDVDPELVEPVRRCLFRIQRGRTADRLAELLARCGGDERVRHGVRLRPARPADQVHAGQDVAPLVRAAHLKLAAVLVVQHEIVVSLEQHVAELRVRDPLLPVHPSRDRLLTQHVVDGEVLAHISQEVGQPDLPQPVCVVDNARRVGLRVEVQKMGELEADVLDVLVDLLDRQQLPFVVTPRWIADHPGSCACDRDRGVAVPLHPHESHDRDHVADVKTARGRVKPDVHGYLLALQQRLRVRGDVVDRAPPAQLFDDVHATLHVAPGVPDFFRVAPSIRRVSRTSFFICSISASTLSNRSSSRNRSTNSTVIRWP